ncbi:DUF4249 domain-containing protein [Muricauda sp. SCSIO 64092]|uniref:DUF4249 domain-containing protein n=1 Tax=Allomuricauda sp. SCSIO 64092 TaxID=2908842 RepID=UPI001FF58E17|nr:DUF4249 domain-containing protein [Muricauda sp. SCSIO 64092]UOY08273.1 DUF4249 domain-containing protein [Muricauda sp. SCSIO 64092]
MRRKNSIKWGSVIFGILWVPIACETDVTNDLNIADSEPRLVLQGGIERNLVNPLPKQQVRLTTTANFLDDVAQPIVEDAVVTIFDGVQDYPCRYAGNGVYETDALVPSVNTEYTITINWEGDTYVATDNLNPVPRFNDLYFIFEEETLFSDEGYFLQIDTQDPPGIPNFYYYRVARNGEFIIVPDPGNSTVLVVSDEFFDGRFRTGVNPNDEVSFEVGDVAIAQQLAISEVYHDYLFLLFEQTGNAGLSFVGNPPPASIRGNIINLTDNTKRALGFFYAAEVEEGSLVITE